MPISDDWPTYVRELELPRLREFLPQSGRLLEFGAGSGQQALRWQQAGFSVEAIDLADSVHLERAVFPVRTYDGRRLPYPDARFDAIVSSNVLEHVTDLQGTLSELARVAKPDAPMLHIMPSASWRLWTSLAEFPAAPRNALRGLRRGPDAKRAGMSLRSWKLRQLAWAIRPFLLRPHGARGSAVTEFWTFRKSSWRSRFAAAGYEVLRVEPLRFWYTGEVLLGGRLSPRLRARMSAWLGSSTTLYVTRARPARAAP